MNQELFDGRPVNPTTGSHLPVLMKLVGMTSGPVLELGSGYYSTPFLHWACFPGKRRLVTYETSPEWWNYCKHFQSDFHEVYLTDGARVVDTSTQEPRFIETNWDPTKINLPWSVAFVDHDGVREMSVRHLLQTEYVVCHDTENKGARYWGLTRVPKLFKYHWDYDGVHPRTSVYSNVHELSEFHIP
jgi:hypothetical protein